MVRYKKIDPLFCFGHGLSYSNFEIKNVVLNRDNYSKNDSIEIQVSIKNNSALSGYETIQLYSSNLDLKETKPEKELRAFKKVFIETGKEIIVNLNISVKDLDWFNDKAGKWEITAGKYRLEIGTSSRNIKHQKYFSVN